MTLRQAERITGLTASHEWLPEVRHVVTLSGVLPGTESIQVLATGCGRTQKDAVQEAVEENYRRVCRLVRQRAKYRCENCKAIRPLQCHHMQKRSHGRIDTVENLIALCPECHEDFHGIKRRSAIK